MTQNLMASTSSQIFSLQRIRDTLIRLEDTIIFSLIERAQFAHNPRMYQKDGFQELVEAGFSGSWLEWFLRETEVMHDLASLPKPILPPITYPATLHPNEINVNARILAFYVDALVPVITRRASHRSANDDENYGSAATRDVEALQAISRRVHYGMFVAESKFLDQPADFVPHILKPNPDMLLSFITKPDVEAALLVRLARKAALYGQDIDAGGNPLPSKEKSKVEVDEVVKLYRDYIIPLTKDVEVEYLLHRLDGLSQSQIEALAKR